MNALEGKVTLITGAKGGLGSFVTEAFLAAGARVVGVSRSIQASDFAHPEFTAMPAELSSGEAARKLADELVARFGRIDALVHVMGGFAGGKSVAETDDADLREDARSQLPGRILHRARGPAADAAAGQRPDSRGRQPPGCRAGSDGGRLQRVEGRAGFAESARSRWRTRIGASRPTLCCRARWTLPANRAGDPKADGSQWVQPSQVAALLVHLASDAGAQVTGAAIPIYGKQV